MMRRIIYMILGLLLVAGCGKEGTNPIVGTWALVEFSATNLRTGEKSNALTDVKLWTFNESGSAYINGSIPINYILNGRHLTFKYVNSGDKFTYEVLVLNDNKLEVAWTTIPGKYQDPMYCCYSFTKMK